MSKIETLIRNSKVTLPVIQKNLDVLLSKDYFRPRADLSKLQNYAKQFLVEKKYPRMIGLAGLRGTGKTTLLWQTAKYIYTSDFKTDIYFFNVEKLIKENLTIFMLSQAIEKMPEFDEKTVLLFDEVHDDSGWSKSMKILYDTSFAFVICTGSSALLIQDSADLATRLFTFPVYPLQLTEYITISQNKQLENEAEIKDKLETALFYSKNINHLKELISEIAPQIKKFYNSVENQNELIKKYITLHNITRFTTFNNEKDIITGLKKLIRRVLIEDIPKLIRKNYKYKNSEKILLRLAASDEINLQSLSQSIGISVDEINETLDILADAELLNILDPYGGVNSKINKTKKAFFMSPSIRLALISKMFKTDEKEYMAKFYEDIIVMYLRRFFDYNFLYFSSNKTGKNPDFIINTRLEPILLEVGTNKKSVKQISDSKIKYRYGIIVNAETEDIKFEGEIVIIPLKWFLLL